MIKRIVSISHKWLVSRAESLTGLILSLCTLNKECGLCYATMAIGTLTHLTCIWQYRGPGRCSVNVLALLAYDYLKVGDSMTRHCEQNGCLRLFKSMEHLNYACRVEDFFFCKVSFAL